MSSKYLATSRNFFSKSGILKAYILIFFAIFPQNSSQKEAINKFLPKQGLCTYKYDEQNRYTCELSNAEINSRYDVLEIVGEHLPENSNDNVEAVIFKNNVIKHFNGEILEKFVNLKYIELINQGLQNISENAFEVCRKLEEFHIGVDPLTTFPFQMFKNCENLKIFVATTLKINAFPEDLFGATRNLEVFVITGNELSSIPEKLLQNMINLRYIYIDNNQLSELSPNFLSNVINLERFSIWMNKFQDPQPIMNILEKHTSLKELYLSMNNFPNFNFAFFEKFQKLEILWIGTTSGPKLTQISWKSLPKSLKTLVVEGIGEEISENTFYNLTSLQSLTLSGSGIVNLQKNTFKVLANLERISIQNTNLKVLHSELFTSQRSLSDLNLSNNQIEEIPEEFFSPLNSLGIKSNKDGIKMSSNKIQRLNLNSFDLHRHMSTINFAINKINAIERGIFQRFNLSITEADFRSNLCIDSVFYSQTNLDYFGSFETCYQNWLVVTTPSPETTVKEIETTTPGGCGSNFKTLEIFIIIFIGFIKVFVDF